MESDTHSVSVEGLFDISQCLVLARYFSDSKITLLLSGKQSDFIVASPVSSC